MKKLFSILMIAIGSFLEVYFYVWRFNQEGISIPLSIIIGAGLTLLFTLAIYQRSEKWAMWIIIPVAIYSVSATSAGQYFYFNKNQNEKAAVSVRENYFLEEAEDIKAQIARIDKQVEGIIQTIDGSTEELRDRAVWRTALADAEKRQKELEARREVLSSRLSKIHEELKTHDQVTIKDENIYSFYGEITGGNPGIFQIILQTLLSTFIAVMSPIGIITYSGGKPPAKNKLKKKYDLEKVSDFIHTHWVGIRSGQTDEILTLGSYRRFMHNKGLEVNEDEYLKTISDLKKIGAISKDGTILEKDEKKAINMLMSVDN